MIDRFNGALLFKPDLFERMRESPQVVREGLMIILLVGVLVGTIDGIRQFLGYLNPNQQIAQLREGLEQAIEQQALSAQTPQQRMVVGMMSDNLDPALDLAQEISMLPTPLPRPVSGLVRALGVVVSRPLDYLGGMLLAVVFTHIAAGWMGGQGSIQQMVGLGALSVAPHALDALAFVPCVGSGLATAAWVWGLAILVMATSVVHRLDYGRATFAVLLFPLIGILLGILACCGLFLLVVAAGAG